MSHIKKIGVMTCGGDCPGLNPVVRGVTMTAITKYGWTVIGIEDSMQGLIDLNYKSPKGNFELTLDHINDIISKGGTILGSDNHSDPFRFAVKDPATGKVVEKDVSDQVIANFKKLGLDALVVIGGDGSAKIAQKLIDKGNIPIVVIPKTIDNDLDATDFTFGFDTAVQTITEAVDKIRDTARSHDRVLIVEVMGRDAGWLALYGGVASGADIVIIPEIPYNLDSIADKIKHRDSTGYPYNIIVIAEGAKPEAGTASVAEAKPGEMARYAGAGQKLCDLLTHYHPEIRNEIRVSTLGYIQRGGSPSNFDRILGTRFGVHAVELLANKQYGYMVSLKTPNIVPVKISDAVKKQRKIDLNDQTLWAARQLGICFGEKKK